MATSSKTKVKLWLSRGRGTFAPARFLAMTRQGFHGRFASCGLACPPIFGPLSVPIHRRALLLCDEAVKMRAVDSCVHRLCSCESHRCLYDWPAPSASPCCQTRLRRPRSPGQRLQTTTSNRRWCGVRQSYGSFHMLGDHPCARVDGAQNSVESLAFRPSQKMPDSFGAVQKRLRPCMAVERATQ